MAAETELADLGCAGQPNPEDPQFCHRSNSADLRLHTDAPEKPSLRTRTFWSCLSVVVGIATFATTLQEHSTPESLFFIGVWGFVVPFKVCEWTLKGREAWPSWIRAILVVVVISWGVLLLLLPAPVSQASKYSDVLQKARVLTPAKEKCGLCEVLNITNLPPAVSRTCPDFFGQVGVPGFLLDQGKEVKATPAEAGHYMGALELFLKPEFWEASAAAHFPPQTHFEDEAKSLPQRTFYYDTGDGNLEGSVRKCICSSFHGRGRFLGCEYKGSEGC